MQTKSKKLWLIGEYVGGKKCKRDHWQYAGLFESKKEALDNCINPNYFIAPVFLNKAILKENVPWKGLYYPIPMK